jgi:hypothetical protein
LTRKIHQTAQKGMTLPTMATKQGSKLVQRKSLAGKLRKALLPSLLVAALPFVNGCALLLAGAATGAVTSLEYSYDNTSRKTVTKHIDILQEASLMALEEMAIKHEHPEETPGGVIIKASTPSLNIKINLERVTHRATKITVNATKNLFQKDPATAAEIVRRTENALTRAALLVSKRKQFAQTSGMQTTPPWQPDLWRWVYATTGERAEDLSSYTGRGDFPDLGPATALVPMKREPTQTAEAKGLPLWKRNYWRWVYATTGEPATELSFYTGRGDVSKVGPATALVPMKLEVAQEKKKKPSSPTAAVTPLPPGVPIFRTAQGERPWETAE